MSRPPIVVDEKIIRKDKEKKLASSALFSFDEWCGGLAGRVAPSARGCAIIGSADIAECFSFSFSAVPGM